MIQKYKWGSGCSDFSFGLVWSLINFLLGIILSVFLLLFFIVSILYLLTSFFYVIFSIKLHVFNWYTYTDKTKLKEHIK